MTVLPNERYDERAHKITAVLSSRLDDSTAVNTVGHMAVALGAAAGDRLLGVPRVDGSGSAHAALARFPFILLTAKPGKLRDVISQARAASTLIVVDYPEEGYATTHDEDYAAALSAKAENALVYIGVAVFGPTAEVQRLCGHLGLWQPRNQVQPALATKA